MNKNNSNIRNSFILSIFVICLFVVDIFLFLFSSNPESILLGGIRIFNFILFINLILGITGTVLFILGLKGQRGYKYFVSIIVNIGSVILVVILIVTHFTHLKDVRTKSDIKGYWYSYNPQWGYYELTFYENEVGLFSSFKGAKKSWEYYIEYPEIDIQDICWDSELKRLNDSTIIIHYNVIFNRKDTLRKLPKEGTMFDFQDFSEKSKWWDALKQFNNRAYANYYKNIMSENYYLMHYFPDSVQIRDDELLILTRKDGLRERFAKIVIECITKNHEK